MPFRVLVIALLTLLVAWDRAHASDDEIREKKALLVLNDFRQWVDLRYQFIDQHANDGTASNSSHLFEETYNGNVSGDLVGPHLFNATLGFQLGLDQNIYFSNGQRSARNDNFKYNYQLTGSGLDRSITPFTITSYRTTETVTSPYSPTYTSTSTGNELQVSLRNALLPSHLTYSHNTTDNTGGGYDTSTTTDTFGYSFTNNYRDLSTTAVSLTATQASGTAEGTPSVSRAYGAALTNTLLWGTGLKYSLLSVAQVMDTKDQNIPQRSFNLTESFQDHLGKALDFQATYALADNTTNGFTSTGNVNTQSTTQTGELQLTHRLFESVITRLKGKYSHQDLLQGYEERYGGYGDINYIKRLPGMNHLTAMVSGLHEVIDNKLGLNEVTTVDQPYPGVHRNTEINLPVGNGTLTAVIIKSRNPMMTYEENVDYTVNYQLAQISILVDGRIDPAPSPGMDLFITYTVKQDSNIKYASNTVNTNASITFQGGKYTLGGSYTTQWMELLDGPANNSLRDSNMKMIYFNGNPDLMTYRVSLSESVVGTLTTRTVDSSAYYTRDIPLGRFSIAGTERFSWYSASETVPSYEENVTTISFSGVRSLLYNLRLTCTANLYDDRSSIRRPKDIATLRTNLNYTLNKMTISMDGQTSWTFEGSAVSRNDTVTVDFQRYF
ncbi:MAG TPA: hypothetical protein VJ550_01960 [Geomonas sp.]|nr:hypothetical protein [Geomonas sp.]